MKSLLPFAIFVLLILTPELIWIFADGGIWPWDQSCYALAAKISTLLYCLVPVCFVLLRLIRRPLNELPLFSRYKLPDTKISSFRFFLAFRLRLDNL